MSSIRILIADDEEIVTDLMAKKIYEAGFEVVTAYNGIDAWAKIQEFKPDLVILDLTMPGLDGWQVLENLRKHPPSKQWVPAIIITALTGLDNIQKGVVLEADHYLTKPCKIDDVLKGIRLMLNLAAQRNL